MAFKHIGPCNGLLSQDVTQSCRLNLDTDILNIEQYMPSLDSHCYVRKGKKDSFKLLKEQCVFNSIVLHFLKYSGFLIMIFLMQELYYINSTDLTQRFKVHSSLLLL